MHTNAVCMCVFVQGEVDVRGVAAYKWGKRGLQPNYWYASADDAQVPLQMDQVGAEAAGGLCGGVLPMVSCARVCVRTRACVWLCGVVCVVFTRHCRPMCTQTCQTFDGCLLLGGGSQMPSTPFHPFL